MKILQIIQKNQLRGAEIFACQLSQHLTQMGHEVRVISLEGGDAKMPFDGEIRKLGVNLRHRFLDFGAWKRLSVEIKAFHPDVVQANAGDTLKYAVLSKILFRWRAPIVFRNASMISQYIRSRITWWINWLILGRVTHIVSVSQASRSDIIGTFHVSPNKVTVIPIGIEPFNSEPISREDGYRYLVHVGGFSFEKNHRGLLRIFRKIHTERPRTKLWLVGDGALRPEIESYCKFLKLDEAVSFLGFRKNAIDYIASADALLVPSIIEGLPGVILEAFYTRTPVIAYPAGGVAEVVENGVTGFLVNMEDEESFATAVTNVLDNPTIARKQTEAACVLVTGKYMNPILTGRFIQLYNLIANK